MAVVMAEVLSSEEEQQEVQGSHIITEDPPMIVVNPRQQVEAVAGKPPASRRQTEVPREPKEVQETRFSDVLSSLASL